MKLLRITVLVLLNLVTAACPPTTDPGPQPDAGGRSVQLSWQAGGTYPVTVVYRVYKSVDGIGYVRVRTSVDVSWKDTAVKPQKTYWYYVAAYDTADQKESGPSAKRSVTVK